MLTVAVPTMDRWSFLKKQLPIYLEHPGVSNVVICDENGSDIDAICESGLDSNPKLRLYQNERVLGVYGNKRQCLLKAPTDYVAILDSDNYFDNEFIDTVLKCIERDSANAGKTVYCAGQNERLFIDTGVVERRTDHFSGMQINADNWNRVLDMPSWNFLLNDGNAVWPKSFAKHMSDIPEERVVGTDSILAMRKAIQAGYTLSVEPSLRYIHTVHDGSHWKQTASVSTRLLGLMNWKL